MIIIKSQKEFDKLKEVKEDEEIIVRCEVKLNSILKVYGKIVFENKIDSSFLESRYIKAVDNSNVEAWDNSNVEARENSNVEARGNSNVEAWGNSNVVAWDNSLVRLFSDLAKVVLYGFSVLIKDINLKVEIEKKSKNCIIQEIKLLPFLERDGIEVNKDKVILFKRVSKDFKTQENTKNETLWGIGKVVTHTNWKPMESECGEGKFHACSKPFFCDEFRNKREDKYIAIEIKVKDLFEWKKNPEFLHKIVFREGKVLYEVNRFGEKI